MQEVINQFISTVNSIVNKKLKDFTPPASFTAIKEPPFSIVSTSVSEAEEGYSILQCNLDASADQMQTQGNTEIHANVHLCFEDGTECDTTMTGTPRELSVEPVAGCQFDARIDFAETTVVFLICCTKKLTSSSTAELVWESPPIEKLKTTIDEVDCIVPTMQYIDNLVWTLPNNATINNIVARIEEIERHVNALENP